MSCNANVPSKIQGTWFYYDYNENLYNELSFYENNLYISTQHLGTEEWLYTINKDYLTIYSVDYEDTIVYKYIITENKIIITNKQRHETLIKSITQIKENDYQTYTIEQLLNFETKFWNRMKVNLKLLEND